MSSSPAGSDRDESAAAQPQYGSLGSPLQFAPPVARPPAKCPVCLGKTTMPSGFYVDDETYQGLHVKCRSCGGRGIV